MKAFSRNTDHHKELAMDSNGKKRVAIACQGGGSYTRIAWGRLCMEPVEEDGENIDEAVQRMTGRKEQEQAEGSEEASPT